MNDMKSFEYYDELACSAETLDDLFEYWKSAHKSEIDFKNTTPKVLFVLKEANILNYKGTTQPDCRNQYEFYQNFKIDDNHFINTNVPKQHEKMGRMAAYLRETNNSRRKNPSLEIIQNALFQSAFMNLNKRGGGNRTSDSFGIWSIC